MAKRTTFQYKETMSINRENYLSVLVRNNNLSKKELRVALHLMAFLDSSTFKEISKKRIAEDLNISKGDVSEAIQTLIYEGVIEEGSNQHTSNGLRLMF